MVLRPAAKSTTLLPASSIVHTDGWLVRQADLEAGRAYQETHPAYTAPLLPPPPGYSGHVHSHSEPGISSSTQFDAEDPIARSKNKNKAMQDIELTAPEHEQQQQQQRMGPAPSPSCGVRCVRCGGCISCKKAKTTTNDTNTNNNMAKVERGRPTVEPTSATAAEAQQQQQQQQQHQHQHQHTITTIINPNNPKKPASKNDAKTSRAIAYLLLFALVFLGAYHFISSQCVSYEWSVADCEAKGGGRAIVKVVKGIFWGSNTLVCELPNNDDDDDA
jgi:hypothetical protein